MRLHRAEKDSGRLVWCLAKSWCFAARDFGFPLGASDEHTRQWSVRSEQRRGRPKELLPEGLRRKWPGASLLLSHRSLRICSFVAPRPRPFWAQRNTSYLRDTTLVGQTFLPRNTKEIPSSKSQFCPRRRRLGAWDLELSWCLELGVWCFAHGDLALATLEQLEAFHPLLRRFVFGIETQSHLELGEGVIEFALIGQRHAEI